MEIRNIISITLELFSLAISLFIVCFLLAQKRRDRIDRIILTIESLSGVLVFFDAAAHYFRGYPGQVGSVMVHLSNFMVFTTNYIMFIAYGICIYAYTGTATKRTRFFMRLVELMSAASIVLIIINQFTGFIYYFDADNFYHRGPFYVLSQLTPAIGGIVYIAVIILNRKKLRRNEFFTLAIYSMAPYFTTFIQILIYGYPFQVIVTVIGGWGLFLSREIEVRNRLATSLDSEVEKQEALEKALAEAQYINGILKSMSEIYYSMHLIDLELDTVKAYNSQYQVKQIVNHTVGAKKMMKEVIAFSTDTKYQEAALEFTDLSTVADRMQNKKVISEEFLGNRLGWYRAQFIEIESDDNNKPTKVVFTTQNINEERKQREALIKESQTDELTGFFNRRAYENDILKYKDKAIEDDLVYISFDVNSLKKTNDTLGHMAGDELLVGACGCMTRVFGDYGKLYRIGGDEFVCLLFAKEDDLKIICEKFDKLIAGWRGKLVDTLSVSYGVIKKMDCPDASIERIAILADQKMYFSKREYYKQAGVDRRQ